MSELQVDQVAERNPWTSADVDAVKDRFSFVVISDRTGLAQPGVFQRGLAVTDLLAPSFAVQIGDMIEGYVTDAEELETQWSEIDEMLSELRTPLFHVPGNHDVSNDVQRDKWLERYGRLYYHFRLGKYLFLVIDTQDPPETIGDDLIGAMHEVNRLMQLDPARLRPTVASALDWEGTQPALVTDKQLTYFDRVLAAHEDAPWIFLFMHMPLWQGEHPAWARLRAALGDRPYSAFAGHVHNYKATRDGPSTQVRLGPTGGLWVLEGPQGNFHHVTQVTVTSRGPVIANVTLDGVRGFDGKPVRSVATTDAGVM